MENKNFEAHQTVIKQNDAGDVLFVVEEGELDCYKLMVRTFFTNYTISA